MKKKQKTKMDIGIEMGYFRYIVLGAAILIAILSSLIIIIPPPKSSMDLAYGHLLEFAGPAEYRICGNNDSACHHFQAYEALNRCVRLCGYNFQYNHMDSKLGYTKNGKFVKLDVGLYCLMNCSEEFSSTPHMFVKKYER